jgi:hypothetical protein
MPLSIVSDRPEVISRAAAILRDRPEVPPRDAAHATLMDFYGLADGDGIYGGSEAALCMGYDGRDYDDNLLDEIVADVAEEAASQVSDVTPGPGPR